MNPTRRGFLALAGCAAGCAAAAPTAWAQAWPARPVRIIIGFPPGGPADILARLIGQRLSERLGQPFVIESRPGAGSNIATEAVARSPADGYTLLLVTTANTINATLYEKLNFDFIRDMAPVAGIIRVPQVIEVHPSVPVTTVLEFIAYAKANPGKLNMASAGSGTVQHVGGELFKAMAGVDLQHVPYRGQAPALMDMLGGQAQVMFDSVPTALEYIRAGKLRALAVTTRTRADALPDLPTVAEFVPGYEFERVLRLRRAARHAGRNRRQAQSRDQQCLRRARHQGAAHRARRCGAGGLGGRLRQAHRRRDREMGQGREDFRRQGELSAKAPLNRP